MTFPESPWISKLPSARVGSKLSCHLWQCPMILSLSLGLLIHSFNTAIKTGPTFPWDQSLLPPACFSFPKLCAFQSIPWLEVRDAALWPRAALTLLQVCLSYSCGCRDLIYRAGPVAVAPATAGLYLAHIWAAFPSRGPFGFLFSIPLTVAKGWGLGDRGGRAAHHGLGLEEHEFADFQ